MERNFNEALRSFFQSVVREELMATSAQKQPSNETKDTRATIRGIRGLATYLGISTATAQRLKSNGHVPYSRIGNRVFFCPSEVDEALKVKEDKRC